jgi:hypothetical protein
MTASPDLDANPAERLVCGNLSSIRSPFFSTEARQQQRDRRLQIQKVIAYFQKVIGQDGIG